MPTARPEIFDPQRFYFRGMHPDVSIGAASDRYAGWLGQIYSPERYEGRISERTNRVGGKSFKGRVLPVDSVTEYFHHFPALEIDYTFYSPLLDASGKPTRTHRTLQEYAGLLEPGDRMILKAPQIVFARKLLSGGKFAENPSYLNPEIFTKRFYEPATAILGDNLWGILFEQEYRRREERDPVEEFAERLDSFFRAVPKDNRYHVELRTDKYLDGPVFEALESHGVGQAFSHWTWLPPLKKQFAGAGRRFFNSGRQCLIRLMTPIGVRYEDAYARAHPFDRLVDGMLQPKMIDDTVEIILAGIKAGVGVTVIINNRAAGNAPLTAREIAERFLREKTGKTAE